VRAKRCAVFARSIAGCDEKKLGIREEEEKMRRKLKNKIALFSAGVLGAGALFALAGCGAVKISVGETIAEGETTIIAHPTKTAAEYTAKENAYILAGKLKSLDSYRSDVEGKVVAMGGLYKQTIADVHIKSGKESYMEALSSSSLVSVGKQAFFTGDKVVMRDSDKKDSFTVTTLQEYRSKIGCEPTALSNYILNEETIKSAELVSRSEGTYTCRYEIDPVKGTSRYAVKMMNFGGLKVAPEFESCTMELTFDEDWNPISLKAEDKYKISKSFLNNVSCTSTLTETFSEIGKDMEIPDAASFRARLGDDVTDIDPDDVEKDELTILADALLNMDLPGGIKICGELTANDRGSLLLSLPVDGWLSFDIEKLASDGLSSAFRGRVSTEIGGVETEFLYPGDGMLYVRVGEAAYRYAIPSSESGTELDDVLRMFRLSAEGGQGNTYAYRLTLGEDLLAPANEAIELLTSSLPDDSPLKGLAINEVGALISIHRQNEKDAGRITGVELSGDFGIASLSAQVVAAEAAETLPNEEALAKYEAVDVEDMAAVLNSVLKMAGNLVNFNVSIRGELTLEAGADRLLSLPVNGWVSLDVEKLTMAGLSGMFSGKLSTEVLGVPVELLYAGDGFLYVQVSGAKYKYSLSELEENIDIGSLLSIFKLSVTNGSDDIKDYKLYVGEEALTALNEALGAVTESLPADSPWKGLSFDELSASLSVYKKGNDPARLAGAQLVADLGVASLRADVIVQAGGEALPSAEELAKYEEAEFVTLSSNLGALLKMAVGVADFDWSAGMNFTLNVGLDSDANGNFMIIPLPVQLQILPEELLAGNVWGCFRMHVSAGLGLSMFGLPDMEIYYDNGTLYIVNTTKTDDGTVYASSVSSVDVKGALAGLAADNLGAILSGIFGGSDTDIVAFLADAVMSAQLEVVSLEDGTLRYQLNAGDKLTALLGAGYGSIWDALNAADIPSMEAFKPLLMMFFNFDIDRVCLRADFKDGALSALSVRLTNDGTAPLGGGEDFSFVVGMMMGEQAAAGEMDESFAFLTSSLAAYEEGASVREKLASLAANGVRWLGDSYGALLDETEAAYNALSEAAKMTVADYPRLAELRKEWTQLRAPVSQLSALLGELKTYDGMAGMEVLVGAILEQSNPIFDALDERQKEYFGDYAVKEYLAIRTKYEKNVAVPELKAAIDKLNRETYGTAAQLLKAISAAQTKYDGLYETSKELVDNYDKIEAARAVQKEMAKEELNAQIKELLAKLGAVTEKTSYEEMKALRQSVDAVAKAYAALSTEEQAGISDYKAFQTASASFSEVLKERFRAAVKALGTADAIVKGDDTYAKIAEAQAWKSLLNRTELSALETETNILTACANKHLAIETSEVEEKISAIGEVTLTDECYQNILKARAAYEGLREDYLTWISNRNSLAEAEADYVKLSIDALNAETATESEVAAVRALYDSAIAAYENAPALHGSVVSRLKDYQAKLEALEQAFAPAA